MQDTHGSVHDTGHDGPDIETPDVDVRTMTEDDIERVATIDAESSGQRRADYFSLQLRRAQEKASLHVSLVAEVDESDGSLRHVHPDVIVINNLEADPLNYYDDLAHIQDTVVEALNANPRLRRVVINADCPGAMALVGRLDAEVDLLEQAMR